MRGATFSIFIFSILAGFGLSVLTGCSGGSPADAAGGSSGAGGEGVDGSGGHVEGSGGQVAGTGGMGEANLCEHGCELTLEADCEHGPETHAECVADCESLLEGDCGAEYRTFQTCSDGEAVECGSTGIPTVPACDDEQSVFIDCLNAP